MASRPQAASISEATRPLWRARVLTLFPEMFPGPLAYSLAGKARDQGLWALETVDIRHFARDKRADGPPFGGGAGMVMRADVLDAALRQTGALDPPAEPVAKPKTAPPSVPTGDQTTQDTARRQNSEGTNEPAHQEPIIYLSPRGQPLTQARLSRWARQSGLLIVCGRYEGIDARVIEAHEMEEVSIGDYVLSGGEPAAMVVIDACVRLLPGVIGQADSLCEESFQDGLLEYPHYTHPRRWQGRDTPEILLSGNHGKIAAWRKEQAEMITKQRRPDLWQRYHHSESGKQQRQK